MITVGFYRHELSKRDDNSHASKVIQYTPKIIFNMCCPRVNQGLTLEIRALVNSII